MIQTGRESGENTPNRAEKAPENSPESGQSRQPALKVPILRYSNHDIPIYKEALIRAIISSLEEILTQERFASSLLHQADKFEKYHQERILKLRS